MTIMVTAAAGFIGMHVAERLLARGESVVGVDIIDDYYDPALKEARAARLAAIPGFEMVRGGYRRQRGDAGPAEGSQDYAGRSPAAEASVH